jgi:glycosyltransferase involved in cell wall biosynthesis
MTVSLILPCLNEIEGLRVYLPDFSTRGYHQLIVLDGGSTDGSVEYAKSMGCQVVTQTNRGMRAAYLNVYDHLTGDLVVTFSPDGNSLPEILAPLIAKLESGYDMVIASRYKDGARSYDDTFLTGAANWAFTRLISLYGFRYTDALVMFRGYRREVPEKLGLTLNHGDAYEVHSAGRYVSWEPLMSIRSAKAGLRIAEIPADEPVRVDLTGQSRFMPATRIQHFRVGFYFGLQLFEELFRWRWPLRGGGFGP